MRHSEKRSESPWSGTASRTRRRSGVFFSGRIRAWAILTGIHTREGPPPSGIGRSGCFLWQGTCHDYHGLQIPRRAFCPWPWRLRSTDGRNLKKPLSLLVRILLASTRENEWVLDPFAGSCTTGIAARLLHRRFFGIDTSSVYLALGVKRFHEADSAGFQSKARYQIADLQTMDQTPVLMEGAEPYLDEIPPFLERPRLAIGSSR